MAAILKSSNFAVKQKTMNLKALLSRDWKLFRSVAYVDMAAMGIILVVVIVNILGPAGNFVVSTGIIGDKTATAEIIGVGFVVVLMNSWLSFVVFRKERLISWFLAMTGLVVAILTLIKVASVVYFW